MCDGRSKPRVGLMIEFRALGPTSLRGEEGNELLSVLSRPKLLSLLAVLGLPEGRGFVRREWVVGLLWSDSPPEKARAALRQALYRLRQALGPGCVESRGEDELRINSSLIRCDVQEFQAALEEGRWEEALGHYRGDLLEGFFPPEAPEFERWLEHRREALRRSAAEAALAVAREYSEKGNPAAGGHWARRAAELAGTDEEIFRHCMTLLAEAGDRGGALEVFEGLKERLADEFQAEPSGETSGLLESIRGKRRELAEGEDAGGPGKIPGEGDAPPERGAPKTTDASADEGPRGHSILELSPSLRLWLAPVLLVLLLPVFLLTWGWELGGVAETEHRAGPGDAGIGVPERAVLPRSHLAVVPLRVTEEDEDLHELSRRLYQDIVSQISGLRGFTLLFPPAGEIPEELRRDPIKLGRLLGAGSILAGTLERSERGIRVSARLLGTFPEEVIFTDIYEGTVSNFLSLRQEVGRELAVALMAAVSSREVEGLGLPFPSNEDAYRPYLQALGMAGPRATPSDLLVERQLLRQSLSHDPDFADAWAALARNLIRQVASSGETEALADSALVAAQTALALSPLSPRAHLAMGWVYLERGFLDRSLESLARAVQLNPNEAEAHYLLGRAHFALGQFDEAIEDFRKAISLNPEAPYARVFMALTYASVEDLGTAAELVREEVKSFEMRPEEEAQLRAALQMWQQDPKAAFQTGMEMVATAPDLPNLRTYLADLALQAGHCLVALEEARMAMAMSPDPERLRYLFYASTILGGALQRCGDPDRARVFLNESKAKLLRQVESGQENPSIYLELSAVSEALGDRNTAIVWLTRAYQMGYRRASLLKSHPLLASLREEPAVQGILADMEADLLRMRETVEANAPPPL